MNWMDMVNAGLAVFWAVVLIANAALLVVWIWEERRRSRRGTSPRPSPQSGDGEDTEVE